MLRLSPGAECRGRRHEGTEEAGLSDHGDDAEEVIEETDPRRRIEGRQGSYTELEDADG